MDLLLNHAVRWPPILGTTAISAMSVVALLLFSSISTAVEFERLSVTEVDGEYRLRTVSVLDAPARYVYIVITDYKNMYRINPSIVEAKVQPSDRDAVVRVVIRIEDRIGPFRFKFDWVGDIEEAKLGELKVTTIPKLSSFESGFAIWEIRPQGDLTWVLHESRLKPNFFIAPLLGNYLVKRRMKDVALATFNSIECHANLRLAMDMENNPEKLKVLGKEMKYCTQLNRIKPSMALEEDQ